MEYRTYAVGEQSIEVGISKRISITLNDKQRKLLGYLAWKINRKWIEEHFTGSAEATIEEMCGFVECLYKITH